MLLRFLLDLFPGLVRGAGLLTQGHHLNIKPLDFVGCTLNILVERIEVLEPVEIVLLDLDKVGHKVVHVGVAGGFLDAGKGIFESDSLVTQDIAQRLFFCKLPFTPHNLSLQLLLLLAGHGAEVLLQIVHQLSSVHVLLTLFKRLEHRIQLSALRHVVLLLLIGHQLHLCNFLQELQPFLEQSLGVAHDPFDLRVDSAELRLHLLIRLLEVRPLKPKLVDGDPQVLILSDEFTELCLARVQPVLQGFLNLLCIPKKLVETVR
mmetsp:Transcript_36278/g.82688  ORF Transcript_36278/g.82688 Transcript_36278/m.82688 type:complete len:262 (-) Transcript_36278:435-1220(-)